MKPHLTVGFEVELENADAWQLMEASKRLRDGVRALTQAIKPSVKVVKWTLE